MALSAAKLVGMDRSSGDWNWGRNDGELHEKPERWVQPTRWVTGGP
jgi:hypothetical protein